MLPVLFFMANELKIRIFIDFWNFQLNWNERFGNATKINWKLLPKIVTDKVLEITQSPQLQFMQYDEIRVYASCNPAYEKDRSLKSWLNNFLNRQTGFRVFIRERKSKMKKTHCKECNEDISVCPKCKKPLFKAIEKGVDSAIITDLFSLSWEKAYDIAVLLSNDADFIPAVEKIQEKGFKVVNATWKNMGIDLSKTCWGSFYIDDIAEKIKLLNLNRS